MDPNCSGNKLQWTVRLFISVHRIKVKENMREITNKVINNFASQARRIQLLFTHDF